MNGLQVSVVGTLTPAALDGTLLVPTATISAPFLSTYQGPVEPKDTAPRLLWTVLWIAALNVRVRPAYADGPGSSESAKVRGVLRRSSLSKSISAINDQTGQEQQSDQEKREDDDDLAPHGLLVERV